MLALIADCVSKSFGAHRVLSSATLRAEPGQVRVIFGRNGQGKSTLFRIAAGVLQPDSGVVRVGTTTFLRATLPHLARHGVFYLPDHDLLSATMRVGAQLALVEQRFGRQRAADAAAQAGVTDFLDRRPGSLSGGELRRAELAVALTRRPTVLIADEPYRGVAPADHDALTTLFRQFAADGCAVVVSGHEVPSLLAAADHITWCTDGTTYELGPPEIACAHEGFRRQYLGPRAPAR